MVLILLFSRVHRNRQQGFLDNSPYRASTPPLGHLQPLLRKSRDGLRSQRLHTRSEGGHRATRCGESGHWTWVFTRASEAPEGMYRKRN